MMADEVSADVADLGPSFGITIRVIIITALFVVIVVITVLHLYWELHRDPQTLSRIFWKHRSALHDSTHTNSDLLVKVTSLSQSQHSDRAVLPFSPAQYFSLNTNSTFF